MKVIKKGRERAGWSRELTCTGAGNGKGGCGAVLLVSEYDIYRTVIEDHSGDKEFFCTFFCPECGVETDVDVPPNRAKGKGPTREVREAVAEKCRALHESK